MQKKKFQGTYIVQDNADKDIQRNTEEVHDCASGFFRDVLGSHLHYGWPKQSYTRLKYTEPEKLKATRERDSSTFHLGRCYEQLSHTSDCKQFISQSIKVQTTLKGRLIVKLTVINIGSNSEAAETRKTICM